MNKIILKAPAKINFGLNVISKREDGYHNIETIFYPINLFDQLTFTKSNSFSFSSNSEVLNKIPDNLILKANELLEEHADKKFNVSIHLEKNIPIGAGMGGGSSDCAAALIGINELFNLDLSLSKLNEFAQQLGSDVSFFLNPKPSFGASKGELLKEINFRIPHPILIVNPGVHISTKEVYERITLKNSEYSLMDIIKSNKINFFDFKGKVTNEFETLVFEEYPELNEIKSELYYLGSIFALMTGTGSTMFGIFPSDESVSKANEVFQKKYFTFVHREEN